MNNVISFILFAIIFGIIDAIWLKSTSKLYAAELGHLMRAKPNFVAAIIFYVIYVAGVTHFSLTPGIENKSVWAAVMPAAALGFVAYATYDLTNLATLKGWSIKIVIIDIIWGVIATSTAVVLTYYVIQMWT
ncbi:DUF2177 family protein [bacterium]|nr:MAG: DUF2177 family protein [bacterium]